METTEMIAGVGLHVGCRVRVLHPLWNNEFITHATLKKWDGYDCQLADIKVARTGDQTLLGSFGSVTLPFHTLAKVVDAKGRPATATAVGNSRLSRSKVPSVWEDPSHAMRAAAIVDYSADMEFLQTGLAQDSVTAEASEFSDDSIERATGKPQSDNSKFPCRDMADVNRVIRRQQQLLTEALSRIAALEKALANQIQAHNRHNEQVNLRLKSAHDRIGNIDGTIAETVKEALPRLAMGEIRARFDKEVAAQAAIDAEDAAHDAEQEKQQASIGTAPADVRYPHVLPQPGDLVEVMIAGTITHAKVAVDHQGALYDVTNMYGTTYRVGRPQIIAIYRKVR